MNLYLKYYKIKNTKVFINKSPNNFKFFKNDLNKYVDKSNIIFTSKFSVTKLIKILSNCKIIIGNESGPICIGAALNKKVISIYTEKTTKPEGKIISTNIKYFNSTKLNENIIVNSIYRNILQSIKK